MKIRSFAAPLATLMAGLCAGAFLFPERPDELSGTAAPREEQTASSTRSRLRIPPHDLIASLRSIPMSSSDRQSLNGEIYGNWAQTEPEGLLGYLEGKAWPRSANDAFRALAEKDPQALIRYACEKGCPDALNPLRYAKDPRKSLTILLENRKFSYPAKTYETLFTYGEQLDPGFHLRIGELPDDAGKRGAFEGASKVMLESKRYDDLFSLLRSHGEFADGEKIAGAFAEMVIEDHQRLHNLADLPESAREPAIDSLLGELNGSGTSDQQAMALLPLLAEGRHLDTRHPALMGIVFGGLLTDDGEIRNPGSPVWKDWALALPEGPGSDLLRQVAIARWSGENPGATDQINSLADPRLRNAAKIGTVLLLTTQERSEELESAIAEIPDIALREKLSIAIPALKEGELTEEFFELFSPSGK